MKRGRVEIIPADPRIALERLLAALDEILGHPRISHDDLLDLRLELMEMMAGSQCP